MYRPKIGLVKIKIDIMKKKVFILLINLLFFTNAFSQETTCNLTSETSTNLYNCINNNLNYKNSINLENITTQILNKIGISKSNFRVLSCNSTYNASAFIYKSERYIVADELFLNYLNDKKNNDYWFYLFILSHEIAHHLNGHTLQKGILIEQNRKNELDCDKFAGLIIKKFGGTKSIILNVLNKLPHPKTNNSSHPIFNDRLKASIIGFDEAEREEKNIVAKYEEEIIKDTQFVEKLNILIKANRYADKFFENYNDTDLENAISYYNVSLNNFEKNEIALEGLALLYFHKNDIIQSKKYYDILYNKTKKDEYLIYSYNCAFIGNLPFEGNLESIDYTAINQLPVLNALYLYFDSKGNIQKGLSILEYAYKESMSEKNYVLEENLIISLNNLCAGYLNIGNYEKANFYAKILESTFLKYSNSIDNNSLVEKYNKNINSSHQRYLIHLLKDYLNNVSIIKYFVGEYSNSINMLELLHQADPKGNSIIDGRYNLFKGKNLVALNRLDEAEIEFYKLTKVQTNFNDEVYFCLGDIYVKKGYNDIAIGYFKHSCELGNSNSCENVKFLSQNKTYSEIKNSDDAINFLKSKKGGYDVKISKLEWINNEWVKKEEDTGMIYLDIKSVSFFKNVKNKWLNRDLHYELFSKENNSIYFSSEQGGTIISSDLKHIMFLDNANPNDLYIFEINYPNKFKPKSID